MCFCQSRCKNKVQSLCTSCTFFFLQACMHTSAAARDTKPEHRVLLHSNPCPSSLVCFIQVWHTHARARTYARHYLVTKRNVNYKECSRGKKEKKKKNRRRAEGRHFYEWQGLADAPFINLPEHDMGHVNLSKKEEFGGWWGATVAFDSWTLCGDSTRMNQASLDSTWSRDNANTQRKRVFLL